MVYVDWAMYNTLMDRQTILDDVNRKADRVWLALCETNPALVRLDPPKVVLNNRLWRTAGRCFQEQRLVDLGSKFFLHSADYYDIMLHTILPHELIHQADFDIFGDSEKKCGHGKTWCSLMVQYGLDPDPYHSMDLKK